MGRNPPTSSQHKVSVHTLYFPKTQNGVRDERRAMMAERGASGGSGRRLLRLSKGASAYGIAALLSVTIALGVAGLAFQASRLNITTGTILLFSHEQWVFWTGGVALAAVAGALTARFARQRAAMGVPAVTPPTTAIFPAIAAFGAVLLVSIYHNSTVTAIVPAAVALVVLAELIARYHLDDEVGRVRRVARTTHVLLTHGVAFLLLATIYINKVRSLLSASVVALLICLLLVQIADGERFPIERRLIYGLVGGVILGEITWALNYWPLTGWTGGAVLLIAFYLVAGLILAQVRDGLRRRDVFEYGLSAAAMFALVALTIGK
jgi:hypothetical protein